MIFDVKRATKLLEDAGVCDTPAMVMTEDQQKEFLFKELIDSEYQNIPDDIYDELTAFPCNIQFEMKDVNFCIVDVGDVLNLFVSLRCADDWDQSMKIPVIDNDDDWYEVMEQCWEYSGDKDADTLIAELTAMGGTYSKQLESLVI